MGCYPFGVKTMEQSLPRVRGIQTQGTYATDNFFLENVILGVTNGSGTGIAMNGNGGAGTLIRGNHLYNLAHFLERGLVEPPLFIQTVFGLLGGIGPHPEDVMHMRRTAERLFADQYQWSVLGAGRSQMSIAVQAASMGGHVRVGLEDSLWIGRGKLADSNAQQVTQARKLIEGLGLELATPDEARALLALKGADRTNF